MQPTTTEIGNKLWISWDDIVNAILTFRVVSCRSDQNSSWVAHVSAVDLASVCYNTGACTSTEPHIGDHSVDFRIWIFEGFRELFFNNFKIRVLGLSCAREALSQVLLYLERQAMLEQSRDFLTQVPVAIANWEEVAVTKTKHVRICKIGVLIDLVGVMCRDSTFSCEWKLGHTVVNDGYLWLLRFGDCHRLDYFNRWNYRSLLA